MADNSSKPENPAEIQGVQLPDAHGDERTPANLNELLQLVSSLSKQSAVDEKLGAEHVRTRAEEHIGLKLMEPNEGDALRNVVNSLWDAMSLKLGMSQSYGASGTEKANSSRQTAVEWIVGNFRLESMALANRRTMPEGVATGLQGNYQAVALQVLASTQAMRNAPGELLAYFDEVLVPTFNRLETEAAATPENLVDLVLQPLSAARAAPDSLGNPEWLAGFVAGLRGYLETQPPTLRQEGYYKTRLGLAQWLSRSDDATRPRQQALFYYHELLSLGPAICGKRVFHVAANNLAGGIAVFLRDQAGQARPEQKIWLSRLQTLSVAAAIAEGEESQGTEREEQADFWHGLGFAATEVEPRRISIVLREMANISSSWEFVAADVIARLPGAAVPEGENIANAEHDEGWMAVMSVLAALSRMAFNDSDDWDEIAAAFFNAGVAVLRVDHRFTAPRIALNGAGLGWALSRGKGFAQILDEYHGLDCAVNLFGALTELPEAQRQMLNPFVATLAAQLFAPEVRAALPESEQLEYFRLKASLQELGIEEAAPLSMGGAPDAAAMLGALNGLFASLSIQLPEFGDQKRYSPRDLALVTGKAILPLLEKMLDSRYRENLDSLARLVGAISVWADHLEEAWRRFYVEPGLADVFAEQGRRTKIGLGAPVAAGAMAEDAWRMVAAQSVPAVPRLAEWIRRYLRNRT